MCKEVTVESYNGLSLTSSVYPVCSKVFPCWEGLDWMLLQMILCQIPVLSDISKAWLREIQELGQKSWTLWEQTRWNLICLIQVLQVSVYFFLHQQHFIFISAFIYSKY